MNMKQGNVCRRFLALVLAVMVCLSLVPASVFAADSTGGTTYTQVTSVDTITAGGKFVLVAQSGGAYYALGTTYATKIVPVAVTVSDGVVSGDSLPLWTIAAAEGGVSLHNGSVYLKYATSGTNFSSAATAYTWAVNKSASGDTFRFLATTGSTERAVTYGEDAQKFGPYATSNDGSGYECDLLVFQETSGGSGSDPVTFADLTPTADPASGWSAGDTITLSVDTSTITDQSSIGAVSYAYKLDDADTWTALDGNTLTLPSSGSKGTHTVAIQANMGETASKTLTGSYTITELSTIAEALAMDDGTANITVKGVVTLLDGNNVYVQDSTGGICVRMASYPGGSIQLGDTIVGTGTRGTYNGTPQLTSATFTASEGMTLTAKETTIGALSTADICTYVKITGLEVTAIDDGDGTSSTPSITVSDGTNSIQLYKAVVDKDADGNWAIRVGDKLEVTVAVGAYNSTLQLRNTNASEITVTEQVSGVAAATVMISGTAAVGETLTFTLDPTVDGATYEVKLDSGEYTAITGNTYTIPEGAKGSHTLYVQAVKDGKTSSAASVKYVIGGDSYAQVTSLVDGDYVMVVAMDGKYYALGTSLSSGKIQGTEVTLTDGKITGADLPVWTVDAVDGGATLNNGSAYLAYGSGTNVKTATAAETWSVKEKDGTFQFYNAANNRAVAFQGGTVNKFGAYATSNESNSNYALYFMLFQKEEDPAQTSTLSNLDKVYLYYPAGGKVLTATASGSKLTGVDGTVTDGKLAVEDGMLELVVSYDAATGYYQFVTNEGLYLTTKSTGSGLSLATASSDYSLWTLEAASDGCYIKSVNAVYNSKGQYLEYYNGFTTYSFSASNASIYTFQFYKSGTAASLPVYTVVPSDNFAGLEELADQQQVVVYSPSAGLAMTCSASRDRLTGTAGKVVNGVLTTNATAQVLTVVKNSDGSYSFVTADGEYLVTGASGNCLVLDSANGYECWKVEKTANGYILYNTVANYNGSYDYAIEVYGGNFTTYGYKSEDENIFTLQFFDAAQVKYVVDYSTDKLVEEVIATWGGGAPIEGNETATTIYGDKYVVNDQLDTGAELTVRAGGTAIAPYYLPGSKYYMGGQNVGASEGDYVQFAVDTSGWGDMTLSFRLRATSTAAGSYQLCYSTDGGNSFDNFENGTYSYAYYNYAQSKNESANGSITDGVATIGKYVASAGAYVTFEFTVPSGAENCENLLIRLVPGSTRADGDETKSIGGNIRLDSVELSGYPINEEGFTSYVEVTPDGVDADVPAMTPLTMTCGTAGAVIQYRFNGGQWQTYDPAELPVLPEELPAYLEVKATSDGNQDSVTRMFTYAKGTVQAVKVTPNGGGIHVDEAGQVVTLSCDTEGATIYYSLSTWEQVKNDTGEYVDKYEVYDPAATEIKLEKGFGELTLKAYAEKESFTTSSVVSRTFTERTQESYNVYFGQLHSHTNYSDGAGSCEEAFQHATEVHEQEDTLDFLAVTDHSNSFDNDTTATFTDGSVSAEWVEGHALAEQYTTDEFVGIYGYEMTWSNGLGHINTFNSDGFQSRNQEAYKTYATALQNYYATLKTDSATISQFNHPGTTFGDFSDFAYYDEEIDGLITMIEVGNGEGAIGSSGYFPSYEYYTRALDKGWHVAPTNNQDNHKGNWGNSNTGRTVVLADTLTRDSIYDALRNYRVYATEDNDLSIIYTLDGNVMGTILTAGDVSDTVSLSIALEDPTDTSIGKVEVIVNGGLSIANQSVTSASETVTFEVPADYSYYYIKVTQPDGDIAVTAPVWVGEVEACGISSFSADSDLAVQGEELNLTLDLYNNEKTDLQLESIEFSIDGEVIHTADLTELSAVKKLGTATYSFGYTYDGMGATEYVVTVKGKLNGVDKVYTDKLSVTYYPTEMVTRVIVDGTHNNDYVTGYYGGNMDNFVTLASGYQIQVTIVTDEITPEMLAQCDLLVVSAPAKTADTSNTGAYKPSAFSDDFIAMVADFVAGGGNLVTCGLADYQDSRINTEYHSAYQINRLLAGVGSKLSINDDEAYDTVNNGGENQPYRLNPVTFNTESAWVEGIVDGQTYSAYSGCTVNAPEGTTWLVKGYDTTYSIDSDKDKTGNLTPEQKDSSGNSMVTGEGDAVFLACEEMEGGGTVFAASTVFLSNFEISAELDNWDSLPYANRTIAENILGAIRQELPLSDIADVRSGGNGDIFRIQGYVTAGTANENTKFFDAIYLQDATGGITVFPYSELGLELGMKVEIVGYRDEYQGDAEIQIMSYKILDEEKNVITPEKMSAKDAMDYDANGGELIQVEGTVKEMVIENGIVSQFVLVDENGDEAKIFIDGYILSGTTGKNELVSIIVEGNKVSAVGLLYKHPEGSSDESVAVLRVRDCDEVVLISGHTHNFQYVSDGNATCTADGTKTGVCSAENCGARSTVTDEGSKLQHSFTKYTSDGNATCTADGTKTALCDYNCGAKDTAADPGSKLGHTYVSAVTKPTVNSKGYTTYTCKVCGHSYQDNYTEMVDPSNSQTGDETPLYLLGGTMICSVLALAVLILGKKKRYQR